MEILKNLTEKQKQRVKIFSVIGVIVLIIVIGVSFTGKKTEQKKMDERKDKKFSILSERVEKDLWIAAEGQNIKALEKSNEEMKNEIEKLRKEIEDTKTKALAPKVESRQVKTTSKNSKGSSKDGEIPPPSVPPLPEGPDKKAKGGETKKGLSGKIEEKSSTIRVWQNEEKKEDKKQKTKEKDHVWIPTGSISRAVLLSGMDVPTSMGARSEPYPILMTLTEYSILPNRFRMDMKECFVVGAGYGNMVEERAYIRTETLSCIRNDGSPWEVSLKGQIMGEDGKLGLRGKLISKQGKQIAMSIVTGILAGLGDALKPQTALSYIELDKSEDQVRTITPKVGDVLSGAGLAGTGLALNRISDYYLKLAEQMYPVIEIEAGREVEIVIVKGGKLVPQESIEQEEGISKEGTPKGTSKKKKG